MTHLNLIVSDALSHFKYSRATELTQKLGIAFIKIILLLCSSLKEIFMCTAQNECGFKLRENDDDIIRNYEWSSHLVNKEMSSFLVNLWMKVTIQFKNVYSHPNKLSMQTRERGTLKIYNFWFKSSFL